MVCEVANGVLAECVFCLQIVTEVPSITVLVEGGREGGREGEREAEG